MKLRIDSRPSLVVLLLAAAASACWLAALVPAIFWIALPLALFYSLLLLLSVTAALRILAIERWIDWTIPGRLLILAPHEDDCVISAGGVGLRNVRLRGITRIVYLARDESPGLPARRAAEALEAWRIAGLEQDDLCFLDLLPPLECRDPAKLRQAARILRAIVDEFRPTAIVVPAFEGGHVHHDMVARIVAEIVRSDEPIDVFEAPEYSPYVSLLHTPHRVLALTARWLFGMVSYNGPPDGIDGRRILRVRLTPEEIAIKRRMLAAFASQNAPSLVATRSYPDRLMSCAAPRRYPFDFGCSYLRLTLFLRRRLPPRLVDAVLPAQHGTIGRTGGITDWETEWSLEDVTQAAGGSPNRSISSR